jgi:hypothetical protein
MKKVINRAVSVFIRFAPSLKQFGKGALWAAPLFLIAAFAMGFMAAMHGLPTPQVDTAGLEGALPWNRGGAESN